MNNSNKDANRNGSDGRTEHKLGKRNHPNYSSINQKELPHQNVSLNMNSENEENSANNDDNLLDKNRTNKGKDLKAEQSVPERVSISWHNINVYGKQSEAKCFNLLSFSQQSPPVHIIKNVSGCLESGQILAIMGASGAGKTTLLNVLTGKNLSNVSIKGVVRLNSKISDIDTITALSAYVQQDDLFIGTLTVYEHLVFQSLVRMDQNVPKKARIARINQVINELGLTKCKNTRIGSASTSKSISGGEKKRLAFASEVLTNPSLMFCDEPTSGLDAFMAQSVVTVLKRMASHGRTVICTIHQPSSEVFMMFDNLLLLADGRVAYLGKLDNALEFFSSQGLKCPINFNPADFFIHELAVVPGKEVECKNKINNLCDQYLSSNYAKEIMPQSLDSESNSYVSFNSGKKSRSRYRANWCQQFEALIWRSFVTVIREPMISTIRLIQTLVIALILGSIYLNQKLDQNGIMNINGALFLLLTNMTFQNSFAVINTFSVELPIFLREHNNGMYRVDAYFLAKMIAELPTLIIVPTVFVCVYYYMVGLHSAIHAFLICILIATLIANCAASFGYLISCISSSITVALSIGPPIMIPLLLFGGFFLNNASVPVYFIWLKYISWFYYGNEALMINQWQEIDHIKCADNSNSTERCLKSGQMVLKMLSFDENNFIRDLVLLFVLLAVIRFCAFLALLIRSRNR